LCINLPLTEIITQIPIYAKFFKDILSNRRRLEDAQIVSLNSNGSALIMNELPKKLVYPGNSSYLASLKMFNLNMHFVIWMQV
jgi:hypothetical protein